MMHVECGRKRRDVLSFIKYEYGVSKDQGHVDLGKRSFNFLNPYGEPISNSQKTVKVKK